MKKLHKLQNCKIVFLAKTFSVHLSLGRIFVKTQCDLQVFFAVVLE